MIQLCSFQHARIAQAFVDYLNLQGLTSQLLKEEEQFVVYLKDATKELQARKELEAFLSNPNDSKYLQASWHTGVQYDNQASLGLAGYYKNFKQQSGWVTQLAVLLSLLSFAVMHLAGFQNYFAHLQFSPVSELLISQKWWRLVTPIFIHFDAMHLVFNLLWLWLLGGRIENSLGSKGVIWLILITALFSNYGQYLVSGAQFGGMSGVVYGLLGFCWIYHWLAKDERLQLSNSVIGFMLLWLVFGYTDLLWINMANTAHTLGLISGCIVAALVAHGAKATSDKSV